MGFPVAIAGRGHGIGDTVLRAGAQFVGRLRVRPDDSFGCCRIHGEAPHRRCVRVGRAGGRDRLAIAGVGALAGAILLAWPLLRSDVASLAAVRPTGSVAMADPDWMPYAPAQIAELTASGRPVFVDFTAAWCVTCQVNKRLVLNTADVRSAFAQKNVALVRADWTRRDPDITRALTALGRSGVPVYVLYRPGRAPLLLPEVLQTKIVEDALGTL